METTETMREKISLLNLPEEEEIKLKEKFMPSLSLVSVNQIKEVIGALEKVVGENPITKAREVKVLTIPVADIEKSASFMKEAGEPNIYSENIIWLGYPVVDLYKRINYCRQYNIPYRNEDGTYKEFLFKESLFQKIVNESTLVKDNSLDESNMELTDIKVPEVEEMEMTSTSPYSDEINTEHHDIQDIQEYMAAAEKDLGDIEAKTTSFKEIANNLNGIYNDYSEKIGEALDGALDGIDAHEYDDSVYHFGDDLGTPMPETFDLSENEVAVGRGR